MVVFWTEEQTITPVFNKSNEITNYVAVQKDVTERKNWEEKIKRLNEELEQRVKERTIELKQVNTKLKTSLDMIEKDLESGKKIQFRLLPEIKKNYYNYEFSRYLIPSLFLSGDFVDYFSIDERYIGFYFADVCGHGASSAFITVFLKAFIDGYIKKYKKEDSKEILHPEELLVKLNSNLLDENLDKHLTIFYGVLDTKENLINFTNCGSFPYPIIHSNNETKLLSANGSMPIGLYRKAEFKVNQIELPESFTLLFASDGVLEILPQENILDKQTYLEKILKRSHENIDNILDTLSITNELMIPDDITFLMIKRFNGVI